MRLACLFTAAILTSPAALAQADVMPEGLINLSVTGDGKTPSALDLVQRSSPSLESSGAAASVGSLGDASYGLPLSLPEARLTPELSLSYSSGGGLGRLGRGWSLSAGPTIRRPTGPHGGGYHQSTLLVSGGGFDGWLVNPVQGDNREPSTYHVLQYGSNTPGEVAAAYDEASRTWTLSRGGITYTLEPDSGSSRPLGWHLASMHDTTGNRVDLSWNGERLEQIDYGGSAVEAHFLSVRLAYEDATHSQRSYSDGVLQVVERRLSAVELWSSHGHAQARPRLRYVLTYDSSEELLTQISQQSLLADGTEEDSRVLAWLSYTDAVDAVQTELTEVPTLPYTLSTSQMSTDGLLLQSSSHLLRTLSDISGDGLPDLFAADLDTSQWQQLDWALYPDETGSPSVSSSWLEPAGAPLLPSGVAQLDETVTVSLQDDTPPAGDWQTLTTATYATQRWLDLNSDGFMDLAVSTAVPVSFGEDPFAQSTNEDPVVLNNWQVYYGEAGGVSTTPVTEPAPFKFLRVSRAPKLPKALVHPTTYDWNTLGSMQGATLELMDLDGDGWQDLVHFDQGDVFVYWREPVQGGGWSSNRQLVLDGLLVDNVLSTQTSLGWVDPGQMEPVVLDQFWEAQEPAFSHMEQHSGFLDLNGDGLVDYVHSHDWELTGSWTVHYNTGAVNPLTGVQFESAGVAWPAPVGWLSRTEEGRPEVDVCSGGGTIEDLWSYYVIPFVANLEIPNVSDVQQRLDPSCKFSPGHLASVLGGLQDLDGDGRQDLVVGESHEWYRNTGDGFELADSLPSWFPVDGQTGNHVLSQSWTYQPIVSLSLQGGPQPETQTSSTYHHELVQVTDLDRDGLLDVVSLVGTPSVQYSGRAVSNDGHAYLVEGGVRPGLLEEIELGTGSVTRLTYRSSSTAWPSGDASVGGHETPSRKDLVSKVEVEDVVTGWRALSVHDYSEGLVEAGRWLGFAQTEGHEYGWEPDFEADEPAEGWSWMGASLTTYQLEPYATLPTQRVLQTDGAVAYLPGSSDASTPVNRWRQDFTYVDHNFFETWPDTITVTQHNEDRHSPLPVGLSRSWTVELSYDAAGNLLSQHHVSADRDRDELLLQTDWVSSSTEDALWLPRALRTYSQPAGLTNPGSPSLVEQITLSYDELSEQLPPTAGLLTGQDACGGVGGSLCNESLSWTFVRTPRGAVEEVLAPGGRDLLFDVYDFGETIATSEYNALAHHSSSLVDDLGRVVEQIDPNGVTTYTTYDVYGRVTKVEEEGSGGVRLTKEVRTYADDVVPNLVHICTFRDDALAAVGMQVLDGFGRVVQEWKPHESDNGWVVTDTEHDTRGRLRLQTQPHRKATMSHDYWSARGSVSSASWSYSNLLGEPVYTHNPATGDTQHDLPEPGTNRSIDAEGFERHLVHDTHGRLVEVRQGQPSAGFPVQSQGSYAYDGRDRVLEHTDGAGNRWRYVYDGAGRQRQVLRREAGAPLLGAFEPYYAFTWDGPDPLAMYEGVESAGDEAVVWQHDLLGRVVQQEVTTDGVTPDIYTWTYDTRAGQPSWYGALLHTTDPAGEVNYRHEPDPTYGGLGYVTRAERTWGFGNRSASFEMSYDEDGRELSKTWPSGVVVGSSYHDNGTLASQTFNSYGSVQYLYDNFGLPAGWTLTRTWPSQTDWQWNHAIFRSSSEQIERLAWEEVHTNVETEIDLSYYSNGLLQLKDFTGEPALSYTYDGWGRIDGVYEVPSGTLLEGYAYDGASNPTSFEHLGVMGVTSPHNVWSYAAASQFSEVPSRGHSLPNGQVVTDAFTYDPTTSRMLTWDTDTPAGDTFRTFTYEGTGRLRHIERLSPVGTRNTSLFYDAANALVLEQRSFEGNHNAIWRFSGWRENSENNSITEQILPMARLDGGQLRVVYTEADGHAVWTRNSLPGASQTEEVLGAYGLDIDAWTSSDRWALDAMHGAEPDRVNEVMHLGARHLALRDGLWLQPEPLLHLGMTNGNLENPLGFSGLYSAGNTNRLRDRDGYTPVDSQVREGPFVADNGGGAFRGVAGGAGPWAMASALRAGSSWVGTKASQLLQSVFNEETDDTPQPDLDTDSSSGSQGESSIETAVGLIEESGASVRQNPKGPNQEGNITLDFGEGNRVNIRVETHPLESGGEPERHANVEVVETRRGKSRTTENTHIVEGE